MKRIVTAAMVAMALMVSACSNNDSKSSGGGNNGNKGPDINAFKSNYPAVRGTIKGGWNLESDYQNGVRIDLYAYFSQSEMRLAAKCDNNGQTISASVSARIQLQAGSFEILEDVQSEESNGELKCSVSIERGDFTYSINQFDQLVLPNGRKLDRLYQ